MKKKNKIKYVVNCRFASQKTTGVQRYALECSRILKNILGNQVIFVAPKGYINPDIKRELDIQQFGILRGYFWEQISLPLFNIFNNSILFCFCGTPPVFLKNVIYTIHDLSFARYPDFFNFYYQFFYKHLVKIAYKRFLGIITVSTFTKNELFDIYGIRKIFIVGNTVNHLHNIKKNTKLPSNLKNTDYYLTLGSIDPRKNIQQLIKVFLQENVNAKLVIIGAKNSVFAEQKYFDKLNSNKIIFTGYLPDHKLASYYKAAKCFIFPSIYEGFGIPPLEAIYYQTPVLLSNIPVHKEIYGSYAHYFSKNEIKNIQHNVKLAQSKLISCKRNIAHPLLKKYNFENQRQQLKKVVFDNKNKG